MRHHLKTLSLYFEQQNNGNKGFEFRKNDRDFKVGDELRLDEISVKGECTGNYCIVKVTYILSSVHGNEFEGIEPGYCVMSTDMIAMNQAIK